MAKRFYWLKLKEDFFKDMKIKKLRRIAGGDTYTIIYLKLLLMSLKTEGKIYHQGVEETIEEEISLEIDEDVDNVRVTVNFLLSVGLMEQDGDISNMTMLPEMVGRETDKAAIMRKRRNKEVTMLPQSYSEVTLEKETREREEIEIEKKGKYEKIIDLFHSICISYPKVRKITEKRKEAINARLKTYSVDEIRQAFEMAEESRFLKGGNDRNWCADFDWIMKDSNMAKIIEGKYSETIKTKNKFNDFEQRSYNYDDIERRLRNRAK